MLGLNIYIMLYIRNGLSGPVGLISCSRTKFSNIVSNLTKIVWF
jgi:hypothetical protein